MARTPQAAPNRFARAQEAAFEHGPRAAAAIAFAIGALALFAAAAPSALLLRHFGLIEQLIDEAPEFTVSVAGVALMALAVGLNRRLDTAWAASGVILAFLAGYAVIRHEHYLAAGLCVGVLGALVWIKPAFYRHAELAQLTPTRAWYVAVCVTFVLAVIGGLLWAGEKPGFAAAPWWALLTDPHLGRPGRAVTVAAAFAGAIAAWRLMFAPHRAAPPAPGAADLARAAAIIDRADEPRPEAALALLADKSFLFAPGDAAFMMYARSGGSLIAMLGPVGKRAAWRPALSAFRDEAERQALRPVIYGAGPNLADFLDLGFKVEKIGETALVNLKTFSLAGGKRQNLRTARRRFVEREHAHFEIYEPPHEAALLAALQPVSDAWLQEQKGGEKGFSLGRFDRDFIARGPIAVVRLHGRPAAFATLWTTHDRAFASVDLMRHDSSAPHGIMDFLFAELLLWAQAGGYGAFDLGMAPLSGLAEERHAPLFARVGRVVFERGSQIYNFEGLRRFKEKFGPDWEPRYLAAPGAWSMPLVLAEAALLTSGGASSLLGRKPSSATAAGPSQTQPDSADEQA